MSIACKGKDRPRLGVHPRFSLFLLIPPWSSLIPLLFNPCSLLFFPYSTCSSITLPYSSLIPFYSSLIPFCSPLIPPSLLSSSFLIPPLFFPVFSSFLPHSFLILLLFLLVPSLFLPYSYLFPWNLPQLPDPGPAGIEQSIICDALDTEVLDHVNVATHLYPQGQQIAEPYMNQPQVVLAVHMEPSDATRVFL